MTLTEAVEQVLLSKTCTTYAELSKAVQALLKRRRPGEVILEAFMDYIFGANTADIAYNGKNGHIIYREKLFKDAVFRLEMFEEEISEGYLIIPGRFIPFFHTIPKKEKLHFEDEKGEPLPIINATLSLYDNEALSGSLQLLPPYADLDIKINYAEANVTLPVIDMKKWLRENPMKSTDQLLVTTLDYEKHRYRIQQVTAKELSSDKLLTKSADKALLDKLTNYLGVSLEPTPIDLTLFWAFATLSTEDHPILKKPGSPISFFVKNQKDIQLYTHGEYPFVHFNDYMKNYLDDMILEENVEPPPGTAIALTDILFEMGSSSSKGYFAGKMIQQMQSSDTYDLVEISDKVFSYSPYVFANKKQEKNYEKAIKKLEKEIDAQWSDRKMSLPVSQALNKALNIKEGIMDFIHAATQYPYDDMEQAMTILFQIRQIDVFVDQILDNITSGQALSPNQARELSEQLSFMKNSFQDLAAAFDEDF